MLLLDASGQCILGRNVGPSFSIRWRRRCRRRRRFRPSLISPRSSNLEPRPSACSARSPTRASSHPVKKFVDQSILSFEGNQLKLAATKVLLKLTQEYLNTRDRSMLNQHICFFIL